MKASWTFLGTHSTTWSVKVMLVDINRGHLFRDHEKGLPGKIMLRRVSEVELIYEINSILGINIKIENLRPQPQTEFTLISNLLNRLASVIRYLWDITHNIYMFCFLSQGKQGCSFKGLWNYFLCHTPQWMIQPKMRALVPYCSTQTLAPSLPPQPLNREAYDGFLSPLFLLFCRLL